MFPLVCWHWYLRSTQNNLQSAKNKKSNAQKPVKEPTNETFNLYLGNGTFD